LISTVSIVLIVSIVSVTQNVFVGLLVGLIADSIQIVTYVVWFFQKEVPMTEVPKQVEQIHKYITLKEEKSKIKEELISRLVNEGAIGENELYSLIRNKEIILAFPYGEGVLRSVRELAGFKRPPLSGLLEQVGFVRVTRLQNLMVAFVDALPKGFRKIDNLSLFIQEELPSMWTKISSYVKDKYPEDRYPKKFEKWRSGEGFSAMYILSKSMAQDFIINYIKKESFTPEFKKRIWGVIDRGKLKEVMKRRKHKVKEVVSKISIDFLLKDIPNSVREVIVNNEDTIKKTLGIKVFTDYRLIEPDRVSGVLAEFLPSGEKKNVNRYSSIITSESKECYELLKELGISF
jgi:hypothetical protein